MSEGKRTVWLTDRSQALAALDWLSQMDRTINPPIVLSENCVHCGKALDHRLLPGVTLYYGDRHRECQRAEAQRTKHLCPRPYKIPPHRNQSHDALRADLTHLCPDHGPVPRIQR